MKNKKTIRIILSVCLIISFTAIVSAGNKNGGSSKTNAVTSAASTGKVGSAYRMNINKINLPFDNKGIIAAVNIPDSNPMISGAGGKFAGDVFLFSSGFFLSGYANGNLFSNAVASASLIEDYVPGTVESGSSDPRAQIYVVKDDDVPFSQSWIDWQDAVALGADFYDGNNDGEYNPVDLNGNAKWDADEDRPDLLGDETAWCVYNDGLSQSQRRWNTIAPLGIEVRQTVFGFATSGTAGNIIFVRYRFKYVGLGKTYEPDKLDSVYFGVWADPDLGSPEDDLVACDVSRNAGIAYNDGPDPNAAYGNRPPAFFMDFLSGPVTYIPGETYTDVNTNYKYDDGIDTPLDTAYQRQGDLKGIKTFPGAKNQEMSSFIQYISGDANLTDPDNAIAARNFGLGYDSKGSSINPCNFSYGDVKTGDCYTIDPRFWYSGNPVTRTGWINTVAADARQMTNIGPFTLEKGIEQEVFVAYLVGQGDNALSSIEKARIVDDIAQGRFNSNNFNPDIINIIPPTPELYWPPNNYSECEKYEDILWHPATDAKIYQLQVFEDTDLTIPIVDTLINSAFSLSQMKSGMKYHYHVKAQNNLGSSGFSELWNFTMIMETPVLSAEALSGSVNKLTWIDNSNYTNGFTITRSYNGIDFDKLDTVDANVNTFYDSTAIQGKQCFYTITAFTPYASAKSQNIYVTTITSIEDNKLFPSEYSIKQNYPNPFNPTTAIEYSLPQESNVKVCIYNSLGEIVAELVNGTKPAGNYHVNYNAASLSSGIYFCTIRAKSADGKETYWDIKKMILLK